MLWCVEECSLFASMGLLLVDCVSFEDAPIETPSMISDTPLRFLFSLFLLLALRKGRPCFNSSYQTH